jgi:methyl-accepting chemotaxis protein
VSSFSEMKVATKLSLGFGLIVVLMIISGSMAYFGLRSINHKMHDVIDDKVPKIEWIADVNYNVLDIARSLRNALLEADNPEKMEAQIKNALDARRKIRETLDKLEPRLVLPEGKAIFKRIVDARAAFVEGQEIVIRLLREKSQARHAPFC